MNKYINKKKAILLLIVLSVYVIIITPLLIINMRQQQDLRGRASGTLTPAPGQSCGNVPSDIILIIDRSGSMQGVDKLTESKQAAKNFTDIIAQDSRNRIGLVSFSSTATLNIGLTSDFAAVKNKITSLTSNGYTCHECAVAKANQEIATNGRAGIKKVIVMLTDGQANYIIGGSQKVDASIAESKAMIAVTSGFNTSNTAFFTIGFGIEGQTGNTGYNGTLLQKIAALTGGKYYYPAPGELQAVYQEISLLIGKGLLGGFIFNDLNNNGAFDLNEPKLNGWNVQLISAAGTQTFTTDSTGSLNINGLCDGNYQLKQVLQPGWMQTLPSDPNGYSVTISNGNSFTDKNFGNIIAPTSTPTLTPTPTPKPTCSDGIDNDNNGYIDSNDSSCHTDGNPNNPNSYDPNRNGEQGGGNTCADSKDNNNNSLIDGADPVCHTDQNANNPGSYNPNLPEVNPPTPTPTQTPTPTPTIRPTSTPVPSSTPTPTIRPTSTPVPSSTPTPTIRPTSTPVPSSTPTPTIRPTAIPMPTSTPTPTPNPTPASTYLALTVFHHGIWNSGDNTNPSQTSLSNKNPIHQTVQANLELFNSKNQLIGQGYGPLKYSSVSGNFQGTVGIYPNSFPTGNYYLKIKTDIHLKKLVSGILTITAGKTNNVPAATLVAGDSNNDNQLSILDYNALLDCYSDLAHAVACNPVKKILTDFNDDSFVNQIDYNLFLREIATQPGQ